METNKKKDREIKIQLNPEKDHDLVLKIIYKST